MSRIGTGITFTRGSLTGENVTNIAASGASRPSLSTANLAATVTNPFIGGALMDWGSVTLDFNLDETDGGDLHDDVLVIDTTNAVLVVSFNDPASTTWTVSTFCTDYDPFTIPLEDLNTCSITYKLAGLPAWGP